MGQSRLIAAEDNWVVVGRLGRPFGVKGWIHVHSFTDDPDQLFQYPNWQLKRTADQQTPVTCEAHKPHGTEYIAKFVGWDDRDLAANWTNAEIVVPRSVLPELAEGEYYWQDLIGLSVYNYAGHFFGQVETLWETKANDILVIQSEAGKETLIPYVPEAYNIVVDFDQKTIHLDWPEDF